MSAYIELCRSDDDYALSKLAEAANAAANNGNKICYIKHEGPTSSIVDFRDIEAVAVLKNGLPVAIFSEETFCLNLVIVKNGKLHLTDKMVGGVVDNNTGEEGDTQYAIAQYNNTIKELVEFGWFPDDSTSIAAYWLL